MGGSSDLSTAASALCVKLRICQSLIRTGAGCCPLMSTDMTGSTKRIGNDLLRWEVASILCSSQQLPADGLSLKGLSHLSCIISTALGALLKVEIRELTTTWSEEPGLSVSTSREKWLDIMQHGVKTSDCRSFVLKYFELCIYASEPLVLERLPCWWSVPWIKLH